MAHDVAMIPGLLPIFLYGCKIKSRSGLGTRLAFTVCSMNSRGRAGYMILEVNGMRDGWNKEITDTSLTSHFESTYKTLSCPGGAVFRMDTVVTHHSLLPILCY